LSGKGVKRIGKFMLGQVTY